MASTTTSTGNQKQQIDRLADSAHGAIDRATQTASQVAERFNEKSEELWAMKDDYVETARDYVKDHPFAALGIAAAAGYLLSVLMRSK